MTFPSADSAVAALEATWPPVAVHRLGHWRLREGKGGGKRVSAASACGPVTEADVSQAEAAMAGLGQSPLFVLRPQDAALDTLLEGRGYARVDPTVIRAFAVARMTDETVRRMTAFTLWPPLAIMRDIWAAGGIGPCRLAVMERVTGPKTAIFARQTDRPAGVAFVAIAGEIAMIHAVEVLPDLQRLGVGTNMLRLACHWAQDRGARHLALAVTRANRQANALYASLGMQVVEHYHYRARDP